MEKLECKCAIVGRLAWNSEFPERPVFVRTFDKNNAHLSGDVPKNSPEWQNIKVIRVEGLNIDYFTEGSDIVINNLKSVEVEKDHNEETTLVVKGVQED